MANCSDALKGTLSSKKPFGIVDIRNFHHFMELCPCKIVSWWEDSRDKSDEIPPSEMKFSTLP